MSHFFSFILYNAGAISIRRYSLAFAQLVPASTGSVLLLLVVLPEVAGGAAVVAAAAGLVVATGIIADDDKVRVCVARCSAPAAPAAASYSRQSSGPSTYTSHTSRVLKMRREILSTICSSEICATPSRSATYCTLTDTELDALTGLDRRAKIKVNNERDRERVLP